MSEDAASFALLRRAMSSNGTILMYNPDVERDLRRLQKKSARQVI
jgi:hypothetical protein